MTNAMRIFLIELELELMTDPDVSKRERLAALVELLKKQGE